MTYRYNAFGLDEHDNSYVVQNQTSKEILDQMKEFGARAYLALPVRGEDMKGGNGANALYRVERDGQIRTTDRREWFERTFRYYETGRQRGPLLNQGKEN